MRLAITLHKKITGDISPQKLENFIQNKEHREYYHILTFCAFTLDIVIRYIVIILSKLPLSRYTTVLFVPALFIYLIYLNWNDDIISNITQNDIGFIILFYIYGLVSFILHDSVRVYILKYINSILFTFPFFYLFGVTFTTDLDMKRKLAILAKLIIVLDIAYVFYVSLTGQVLQEDSMERAYRMTPGVLYLILEAFDKKSIKNIIWGVLSPLYLFTCGTRGPIMVVLGFLVYCLAFRSNVRGWRRLLSYAAIVGAVFFFYSPSFSSFLNRFANLFSRYGFSTRNISELLNGTFISNDNGRDRLYEIGISMIKENPFGYGMFGEWGVIENSVHNLYLQFFVHFGVFLGPLLLIMLFLKIFRAYYNNPNKYARDFVAIWACRVLIKGLAGGSYLDWEFAFLLGLCVREIRNQKLFYSYLYQTDAV